MLAAAQAEKKALIDELSKPSGISEEEAIRRGIAIIERAVKNRVTEVEVLRSPHGPQLPRPRKRRRHQCRTRRRRL
jgi:hypothetical protein